MRNKVFLMAALMAGVAAQPLSAKEGMFTPEQLPEIGPAAIELARVEGLDAHGRSVAVRLNL